MRSRKRSSTSSIHSRRGATATEFAVVLPIVLIICFGLMEISRAQTVRETARTAIILGAREAAVLNTDADKVQMEMERVLNPLGVSSSNIVVTPQLINSDVGEVSISINVPYSSENGNLAGRFMGGRSVNFATQVARR